MLDPKGKKNVFIHDSFFGHPKDVTLNWEYPSSGLRPSFVFKGMKKMNLNRVKNAR